MVGTATLLALILVFTLSIRLRQREIDTVFRIGGSRSTIARLLAAEIAIVLVFGAVICAAVILGVSQGADGLVRALFIS